MGEVFYDTLTNKVVLFNGIAWVPIDTSVQTETILREVEEHERLVSWAKFIVTSREVTQAAAQQHLSRCSGRAFCPPPYRQFLFEDMDDAVLWRLHIS